MNIVFLLMVGLATGFVAAQLIEGHALGLVGDLVVGVLGALIGGVIFTSTDYEAPNVLEATLSELLGAVILLSIVNLVYFAVRPRRKLRHH